MHVIVDASFGIADIPDTFVALFFRIFKKLFLCYVNDHSLRIYWNSCKQCYERLKNVGSSAFITTYIFVFYLFIVDVTQIQSRS